MLVSKCCGAEVTSIKFTQDGFCWGCINCLQACETIERKEDDSVKDEEDFIERDGQQDYRETSQISEKVGAQGSVSDTPETDAALIPSVESGSTLVDCDFARTLERERDALKALCEHTLEQLNTYNGTMNDIRMRNLLQRQYQQLTQKEKKV